MELSLDDLQSIMVPFPALHTQSEIADFLDEATNDLDELTQAMEHTIDLLRERRSALVMTAVTGEIGTASVA